MSWEEIRKLSLQLKNIQGTASNQISERDCITIVQQLISTHDVRLYYSGDGLSVFTLKQLMNEIYQELELNQGYLQINQLEQTLNASRPLINNALKEMVNCDPTLLLFSLDSYLLSTLALTKIIQQIEEYVLNKGSSTLDELASLFKMSTMHVMKILNRAKLNNLTLKFHLEKEIVYSALYLERSKSKLQGYIRAAIRPLQIKCIANDNNLSENLTLSIMHQLISSDCIVGQLVNNATYFVPQCYNECQLKCIAEYYNRNNYIPFTLMEKLRFTKDYSPYLKEHFPNAVILSSLCINSNYFKSDDCLEALDKFGWINLLDYLPESIHEIDYTTSDYQILISCMMRSECQNYKIIGYHYLLSDYFYSKLSELLESTFHQKLFNLSESMSKTALLERLFNENSSDQIRHESEHLNDLKFTLSTCSSANSSPVMRKKVIKKFKSTRSVSRQSHKSHSPSPSRKPSGQNNINQRIFFMSPQELEKTIKQYGLEKFQTLLDVDLVNALCDKFLGPINMKFKIFIRNELNQRSLDNFSVLESPQYRLSCEEKILYLFNKLKICENNLSLFLVEQQRHSLMESLKSQEVNELISLICLYMSRYLIPTHQQSDKQKQFDTYSEQLYLASKLDSKTGEALLDILSVIQGSKDDFNVRLLFKDIKKLLSLIEIIVPELNRRIERSINSKFAEALKYKLQIAFDKLSSFNVVECGDILGATLNYLFLHYHSALVPYTSNSSILFIYLNNLKHSLSEQKYTNLCTVIEYFDRSVLSNRLDNSLRSKITEIIEFIMNL